MRVRFYQEIEDSRARIEFLIRIAEAVKNRRTRIIRRTGGKLFGKGLGGFVELEPGENVKGKALALRGEEMLGASPGEEL